MSRVWRALSSFLAAMLALQAPPAWASPPAVHLAVENCDSLDEASIRRLLSADLGAPTTAEVGPDVTDVTIACAGERVIIRVKDPLSRKTLRRSFDPRSFGTQAASRIVAIAASELVLASWAELESNPTPQVPAEGEPPKAEALERARGVVRARTARPAPHARTSPLSLEAGGDGDTEDDDEAPRPRYYRAPGRVDPRASTGSTAFGGEEDPGVFKRMTGVVSVRSFLRGDGTLIGGGLRLGHERFGIVSWAADLLVENGALSDSNVTNATLGGWLLFYARAGVATFRLGGGLRAGMLGMQEGASVAAWGWPMVVTSHTFRSGPIVFDLSAEAGYVDLLMRRGQGLRGPWASGQVGLGIVL
jgi:hypothetical protein